MYSFRHIFRKSVLSSYHVLENVLGPEVTLVNKPCLASPIPDFLGLS